MLSQNFSNTDNFFYKNASKISSGKKMFNWIY